MYRNQLPTSFTVKSTRRTVPMAALSFAILSLTAVKLAGCMPPTGGATSSAVGTTTNPIPVLDATNVSLDVVMHNKTMSDGTRVNFWVFCQAGTPMMQCTLPGPTLALEIGAQANVTYTGMGVKENSPLYPGHTIHPHGLDVPQSEDGVPETGATLDGDTYTFSVDNRYIGSHAYHCHQHTVKHLEMGMYGAVITRSGTQINQGGPSFDMDWNLVLSTVDPAYHTASAVGDSTIFADYNPRYFLVNGQEGLSSSAPSEVYTAAPGANLAIRLIGMHSTNSTFQIKDTRGAAQSFVLHNKDGFKLPSALTVTSLDIAPGETRDVMITLPTRSGSLYPQVSYKTLRDRKVYNNGTVYQRIDF